MKRTLLSLLVVFAMPPFAAEVMGEEDTGGQRSIAMTQGVSAQHPDAGAAAERFGFLRGKALKPGFKGSAKSSVKRHASYGAMPLGILRRVPQQYPTIQTGINASIHGDTVLVSEGIYFENIDYSGKSIIVASLYLLDHDTSHISRTIIDGSQAAFPQSVVWFVSGEDTNSVLCGFTVRGGSGTDITSEERDGGGVFLFESSGKLVRNIITENKVFAPNAWGGGVSMTGLTNTGQTLIMENNIVSRNSVTAASGAGYGGGVSIYQSQFRLTGNVFEYDSARGVYQAAASSVLVYLGSGNLGVVQGNTFRNNIVIGDSSSYAGLTIARYDGEAVIEGNIFEDNAVISSAPNRSSYGGAIYLDDNGAASPEKRITRNVIRRNRLTSALHTFGGAMIVWDARSEISDNLIEDNTSQAGAIAYGGGILMIDSRVSILESRIKNNTTQAGTNAYGGGIYGIRWGGMIGNNIVTGNNATYGGGIGHAGAPPSGITQAVVNNTVCTNMAPFGGGFYDGGFGTISILLNNILWDDSSSTGEIFSTGTVEVHYSNIEGGWSGGTGNINAPPMFADTLYRLADSSPCIGAGRDSMQIGGTWYRAPTRDFGGNSRPMPTGSQPDMGAWENSLGNPTGVADEQSVPAVFELAQNYPNPFNPVTNFQFSIFNSQLTILKVYDVLGREVATLVNNEMPAGSYSVSWDAAGVASGVYLYRLETGGFSETRKLILLR